MAKLTQERLKEILDYDPETGEFHWKAWVGARVKVGDRAGGVDNYGYWVIKIGGKLLKAHRLAWLYIYGYLPENQIDHINRIKHDNRILNLREVSRSCNMRNKKGCTLFGVKGVVRSHGKWAACISVGRRQIWLGTFSTQREAAKARVEAEEKYGFVTCDRLSEAKIFISSQPLEESGSKFTVVSSSGITGITWSRGAEKWLARIQISGVRSNLGYYDTVEEAAEARGKYLKENV
jgi:hypothetical protein